MEALIDRRGNKYRGGQAYDRRSQEGIDYFYSLYFAKARPTVKTCHRMTLAKAKQSGWAWPATYQATTRWIRDHRPRRDFDLGPAFDASHAVTSETEFFDQ